MYCFLFLSFIHSRVSVLGLMYHLTHSRSFWR